MRVFSTSQRKSRLTLTGMARHLYFNGFLIHMAWQSKLQKDSPNPFNKNLIPYENKFLFKNIYLL